MQSLQAEIVCEATVRASSRLFCMPKMGFGVYLGFMPLRSCLYRNQDLEILLSIWGRRSCKQN